MQTIYTKNGLSYTDNIEYKENAYEDKISFRFVVITGVLQWVMVINFKICNFVFYCT